MKKTNTNPDARAADGGVIGADCDRLLSMTVLVVPDYVLQKNLLEICAKFTKRFSKFGVFYNFSYDKTMLKSKYVSVSYNGDERSVL